MTVVLVLRIQHGDLILADQCHTQVYEDSRWYEYNLKIEDNLNMNTIPKLRQPQNEENFKKEDNLKKKTTSKKAT